MALDSDLNWARTWDPGWLWVSGSVSGHWTQDPRPPTLRFAKQKQTKTKDINKTKQKEKTKKNQQKQKTLQQHNKTTAE